MPQSFWSQENLKNYFAKVTEAQREKAKHPLQGAAKAVAATVAPPKKKAERFSL